MKPLTVEAVANAVHGKIIKTATKAAILGVSTDSRRIMPGDLFIPLVGEHFDGHHFIQDALQGGASAYLTSQEHLLFPDQVYGILVADTQKALQDLAAYYLRLFNLPIAAVTGSTGKTTTKDMIASVLSKKYHVLKTEGNFNNEIGLPLTIFRLEDAHEAVVLEMGMSGFGEIQRLVGIAPPKVAVITNIGVSHIEKLGSRENILKAKMEIFDQFGSDCIAVLNADDPMLCASALHFPYPVVYYGLDKGSDITANEIQLKAEAGTAFVVTTAEGSMAMDLQVPGLHNVSNALAAVAVGRLFGLTIQEIKDGLKEFESGIMRLHIFETRGGIRVIDDVYNASPDSMAAALAVLRDMPGDRKIAVLGDMLELGDYSEEGHRGVGHTAAACALDILVVVGNKSRSIAEEAVKAGMPDQDIHTFDNNLEAVTFLEQILKPKDTVLVKGSRGMKMEDVTAYLMERRLS